MAWQSRPTVRGKITLPTPSLTIECASKTKAKNNILAVLEVHLDLGNFKQTLPEVESSLVPFPNPSADLNPSYEIMQGRVSGDLPCFQVYRRTKNHDMMSAMYPNQAVVVL